MTRIIDFQSRRRKLEAKNRFVVEPITRWRVFDRVAGHEVCHVGSEETARQFAQRLQESYSELQTTE